MSFSVLIVDQNAQQMDGLAHLLIENGNTVRTAMSASEARMSHSEHSPDVAIISLPLGDVYQSSLPAALFDSDPHLSMILLVDSGASATVSDLVRRGAVPLERPARLESVLEIASRLARGNRTREELALRRRHVGNPAPLPSGVDMLIDLAARNADAPVLITGEPGTGKSVVARIVHDLSSRSGAPFIAMDCDVPESELLAHTLFGSERGSSPDSNVARPGLIEIADGGSLLLESVTKLERDTQEALLRFLDRKTFSRVGSLAALRSNARIMAADTSPLSDAFEAGLLTGDLFYRLHVLTIPLPPLRERREEIERMVRGMLPPDSSIAPSALLALQQHDWPGNVRELTNVLWRALLMAANKRIELRDLALTATLGTLDEPAGTGKTPVRLADMERKAILTALEATQGNKMRAAALLGIARSTLHDKLRRL